MEDILQVNPEDELKFIKKDIASLPESVLELKNNTDKVIVYKIKTTDPGRTGAAGGNKYVVRPNNGILLKGKGTRISITTQKPTMQKIKNDRFMVVASTFEGDESEVPCTTHETEKFIKDFFKDLPKDKTFSKKLKVVNDETFGEWQDGVISI